MAKKDKEKRYSLRAAEKLLARLVQAAEGLATAAASKRALIDLMATQDFWASVAAQEELQRWSDERVATFVAQLQDFYRRALILQRGLPADRRFAQLRVKAVTFSVIPMPSTAFVGVEGDAADILALKAVYHLARTGADRLRTCECGRFFAKTGRREFCSDRCQKRVYMKHLRAEERKAQERGHGKQTRAR